MFANHLLHRAIGAISLIAALAISFMFIAIEVGEKLSPERPEESNAVPLFNLLRRRYHVTCTTA